MNRDPYLPSNIKAVLFDFDGTLVLTESIGPAVFASILEQRHIDAGPWTDLFSNIWRRIDTSLDTKGLFHTVLGGVDVESALSEFHALFAEQSRLAPESSGATELLAWVKGRDIATAVVSHAPSFDLLPQLSTRGWLESFSVIFPYERFSAPKPDPSCYLDVLIELKVANEFALVIEDSDIGLEAAARAGIAAVHTSCTSGKTCGQTSAVAHVADLAELNALFAEFGSAVELT